MKTLDRRLRMEISEQLNAIESFETDFYPCPLCMEIHEFEEICIEQLEESLKLTFLRGLKDFNDEKEYENYLDYIEYLEDAKKKRDQVPPRMDSFSEDTLEDMK